MWFINEILLVYHPVIILNTTVTRIKSWNWLTCLAYVVVQAMLKSFYPIKHQPHKNGQTHWSNSYFWRVFFFRELPEGRRIAALSNVYNGIFLHFFLGANINNMAQVICVPSLCKILARQKIWVTRFSSCIFFPDISDFCTACPHCYVVPAWLYLMC